ncbi:MAG: hypothetical protein JNL28_04370 [Planctomycetes bacterium]|nr:hypothetical protein [Planctomycetota bacterium]
MLRRALSWILLAGLAHAQLAPVRIGIPVRVTDLVIEGSEVEALPIDPKAPLAVRIVAVRPHGTTFRYDIEYVALEAGEFDAAAALKRKDGSAAPIPAIPVRAESKLGPGIVRPHAPKLGDVPGLGGYRTLMIALGVVWLAGLAVLVWLGRKRRQATAAAHARRAQTLSERLRDLVQRAHAGELSERERAELEMSLVAHWRRRLALHDQPASAVLPRLRAHPEAGPLLVALEEWLHAPPPRPPVDMQRLLAPYRDLQDDELELAPTGAR